MSAVTAQPGSAAFYLPLVETLQSSSHQLAQSVERLSSGNRIINASDDVAALSIGSRLQAQNALLTQTSSNVAQGTSLLQVADNGLTQISTILSAMQTIAQQAGGTAIIDTQRGFLQAQFSSYLNDIDAIAGRTSFGGINLLDGTLAGGITIRTGTGNSSAVSIAIPDVHAGALFTGTPDLGTTGDATAAQTAITTASNNIQTIISGVSGLQTSFNAAAGSLMQSIGGIAAATGNLLDTDIAAESTNFMRKTTTVNAGIAVLAQAFNLSPGLLSLLRSAGNG